MARPQHKNPFPGGHEIYNVGSPFLEHHNYIRSLFEPCPGVEKMTFNEILQFYIFYP